MPHVYRFRLSIITENIILILRHSLEFDLKSLEPIKRAKPYKSVNQYLDINYKLLREECFRHLFTGIQNFLKKNVLDARRMKMYR